MNARRFCRYSREGFTLVELLVVLAIIAILSASAISVFRGVTSALSLSTGTQMLLSELTIARQTALTLDESVQLRFYTYPDSTGATTTSEYQAFQSFSVKTGTSGTVYTPVEKINYLPPNLMISSSTTAGYSSAPLAGGTTSSPAPTDPAIPVNGIGLTYKYVSLTFKSSGAIDPVPAGSTVWMTIHEKKYASSVPINFTTINIDPSNGRVRIYQP
jgi:uncharacterized protein (TIGR02596 family)